MTSPHPDHVREWNAAEFRAFVERCGLVVERQVLLPPGRLAPLERIVSRLLRPTLLRRRWASCQALVCRRADSR
jgi:hypothetical protein